jgi:hypothetical protein
MVREMAASADALDPSAAVVSLGESVRPPHAITKIANTANAGILILTEFPRSALLPGYDQHLSP